MEISEQIKEFRKTTGLSQSKFANYFGIPVRTIQSWELKGPHNPAPYILAMMQKIWKYEHPEG